MGRAAGARRPDPIGSGRPARTGARPSRRTRRRAGGLNGASLSEPLHRPWYRARRDRESCGKADRMRNHCGRRVVNPAESRLERHRGRMFRRCAADASLHRRKRLSGPSGRRGTNLRRIGSGGGLTGRGRAMASETVCETDPAEARCRMGEAPARGRSVRIGPARDGRPGLGLTRTGAIRTLTTVAIRTIAPGQACRSGA